jgi:hypothetical protein
MTLFLILLGLLSFALYGLILYQRFRYDQQQSSNRLKDIIAVIHRRVDELDLLRVAVEGPMAEEVSLWQEFSEAKLTLTQALISHDVMQIATADAEMNRCEFDMKERIASYNALKNTSEVVRFLKEVEQLDAMLCKQVEAYNDSIRLFNKKLHQVPYLFYSRLFGFNELVRFMHEPSTVTDPYLEGAVSEPQ